jgi:hypothetical protein
MAIDDDATAQERAAAETEAAKSKLALASASSAGTEFFNLSSLHAQAVGFTSIKGHVPVELALDTGIHRQWRTFFCAAVRKYALLDHLNTPSRPSRLLPGLSSMPQSSPRSTDPCCSASSTPS